ncbi:hypothetical protein Smic_00260 [Streptomyces microflavus]|uniref:Uncharacterized protein n=1 Tax=Streptomyces microflavus TaxID=1919 RepID=A0A7J0CG45_STRMI|nr:hypothetical protein Smic_00260 [Streptomyces microflavus]
MAKTAATAAAKAAILSPVFMAVPQRTTVVSDNANIPPRGIHVTPEDRPVPYGTAAQPEITSPSRSRSSAVSGMRSPVRT